jgi:predicted permease
LRRTPWYAATTIGVIALSMALATTVFAVVDGVLFKPLPYPDTSHVYVLTGGWAKHPGLMTSPTWAEIAAWRTAIPEARFTAVSTGGSLPIDDGAPVRSAFVSANFFDIIGQHPLLGGFRPEHFRTYHANDTWPLLLSYDAWQTRYGGDPSVVGYTVRGEYNIRAEIVGVLPSDFVFPTDDGRSVPVVLGPDLEPADPANSRERAGTVIARTPPTLSAAAFRARLDAANAALRHDAPVPAGGRGLDPFDVVSAVRVDEATGGRTRQLFAGVFAGSATLILLACLNIAGLSAARIHDRRQELQLRLALGGRGADLVRLLGIESAVVAMAGGAVGLLGAGYGVRLVASVIPDAIFLVKPLAIDGRVIAFAIGAAVVTAIVTSVWPALEAVRRRHGTMAHDIRTVHPPRRRVRNAIVMVQVALGLTLAINGVLVSGSLLHVWRQQPGYNPTNTLYIDLRSRRPPDMELNAEILQGIRALPGVLAAGAANVPFMSHTFNPSSFDVPADAGTIPGHGIQEVGVMPGYLEAAGLTPLSGRSPTDAEWRTADVVVVSEMVGKAYWPGQDPVGHELVRRGRRFAVIGIVPDARQAALDSEPDGTIYVPMRASPYPLLQTVFVRFADTARPNLSAVLTVLKEPRFATYGVDRAMTMSSGMGESVRNRKFQALAFAAFGLAGVVIVGVGVLGLVATATSRRTREVGVRMALGAKPVEIMGLIARQELDPVVAGLAAGSALSYWTVGLVRAYLYKIDTYDARAWLVAIGVLLAAGVLGVCLPARRASRVNPVQALRSE